MEYEELLRQRFVLSAEAEVDGNKEVADNSRTLNLSRKISERLKT